MNWYAWGGVKYFLYEYEYHLAQQSGDAIKMRWEDLVAAAKKDTIEHILPQSIAGIGYWEERFTPEQHSQLVHDIGNLTLTLNNSSLSNAPFPRKKGVASQERCYASSKLFVEQQLARFDDWTPETIETRRRAMEAWARERWHVYLPVHVDNPDEASEVGLEDFRRVLERTSIPRGQRQLYSALYHYADGLTSDELVEIMSRRDRHDLSGVLGALGRRINQTPGYLKTHKPGTPFFFDVSWQGNQQHYRLRPVLRAILDEMQPDWLDMCAPDSGSESE
ncbi:MAG: HNH endonuclease [Anaerolineales bacterium]|nr:HNH endonuclease [Anaerolineales bacterium]